MSGANPFIGGSPIDTLDNCRYAIDLLINVGLAPDPDTEQVIAGRQMVYHGLQNALEHAAGCLGDQADPSKEIKP